jgi:Predicted amidohydrolase
VTARFAVWQPEAGGAPDARIDALAAAMRAETAAGRRLDLVLCPELFLPGYEAGEALRDAAEPADGPSAARLSALARETGAAIVYGFSERSADRLHNAAQAIDGAGRRVALHRKTVLPPGFEADWFAPGAGLALFDCAGLRCAVVICYEIEFPEGARAAAEAGAQVVLAPTALGADGWAGRASDDPDARLRERGVAALRQPRRSAGPIRFLGASAIVAPNGRPRRGRDTRGGG